MKKQNGITLIALVITIIVLLILAGVSISLVIGDNGILTQATDAVMKNREAEAKEDIDMALAGLEAEYIKEWTKNTSVSRSKFFNPDRINQALKGKGKIVEVSYYNEDTGEISFYYKSNSDEGKEHKFEINEDGKVGQLDGWAASLTAENYGDKVNYRGTNGYDDWKIFYSNGKNVFLIASDYVSNGLAMSAMDLVSDTSKPYNVYWKNAPGEMSENARKDDLFGITSNRYKLNSKKMNSRCVSTLLDTALWYNFTDDHLRIEGLSEGYAEYAIGGPTVEMWVNSWNAKGRKFGTNKYEKIIPEIAEDGYENVSNDKTLYYDSLYFSHDGKESNCDGYWLASPSASMSDHTMLYATCVSRTIGGTFFDYNGVGVRPVVALSSDVIGTKVNGIWQLSK